MFRMDTVNKFQIAFDDMNESETIDVSLDVGEVSLILSLLVANEAQMEKIFENLRARGEKENSQNT